MPVANQPLRRAQECARSLRVHRRQCLLLCSFVENALTAGEPAESSPEAAQQWDDVLTNIHTHFAQWSSLDTVQSFLQSDQIRSDIDQLYAELKWCGMNVENSSLQLNEKRRQDEDTLQDTLCTIASSNELLNLVLEQPPDRIRFFVKRLQGVLRETYHTDSVRAKLDSGLMFLYKNADIMIATPDLTSQISDVDIDPAHGSVLYSAYIGNWLGESQVVVKALKHFRYEPSLIKRFRKEVASFYCVKHPNIDRVYGVAINETIGCCIVSPWSMSGSVLSYLDHYGDVNVLSWFSDVVSALQYLHSWEPPILFGCLRAENIIVKEYGSGVYITDFGMFQLCDRPSENVDKLLRWCAPEVIRAARKNEQSEEARISCTRQTDVYCLELLTSKIPFFHIQDKETLEPEILHGTRPTVSNDLKYRASQRGGSAEVHTMMKSCWNADPKKRLALDAVAATIRKDEEDISHVERKHRPESGSSNSDASIISLATHSSRQLSMGLPQTPRSSSSGFVTTPVIANQRDSTPENRILSAQTFSEPTPMEFDNRYDRGIPTDLVRKMSAISVQEQNLSEQTIRPEPRSSFSSDSSEGSHLGQRDNMAYERMPKLRAASLASSKRKGSKDRFEILVRRMTVDGQINQSWAGVASMEKVREIARRPRKLAQVSAVENLVDRENRFCSDSIDEHLTQRLRMDPSILGTTRLENFLSSVFEDSHTLRLVNQHFKNALQFSSDVSTIGFQRMGLLCKEAATQFCMVYPEYVRHLPEVREIISDEVDSNERFATLLKEHYRDGQTIAQALKHFLVSPVTHLDQHPLTLQLILDGMTSGDSEIPILQEAHQEMLKAVNLIHLSSWQQGDVDKEWKDFVSPEIARGTARLQVNRQTVIFELVNEERAYVKKLLSMQRVLRSLYLELETLRRVEDALLQDIVKSLIGILSDLLRFHLQLGDNLFTLQRSQHPFINAFVSTCGIDQIPWHSLYDHRYGTAYRKLADLAQEGKVRSGIIKRIMQQAMIDGNIDFMAFLRSPSVHLRVFVSFLRRISESTDGEEEDSQVISEIFPRLWDIAQQVEMKTFATKERARLSSLAAALDFSDFSAVQSDICITQSSRCLVISGSLTVAFIDKLSKSVSSEERFVILLDNYLILAIRADSQGIVRLRVSEKPIPLDLMDLTFDDSPALSPPGLFFPCATIRHCGDKNKIAYLYASTDQASNMWRVKFSEAMATRKLEAGKTCVMDMKAIHASKRMISCSAEFSHAGQDFLAVAVETPSSQAGIWLMDATSGQFRPAVALNGVTQLTIVSELGICMILAEKILFYYRLEDLIKGKSQNRRSVDDIAAVHFYRIGSLSGRIVLVAYVKRKERNVVRFFEANESGKSARVMSALKGKSGIFNLLTEAELPYHVEDIFFLKSRFIVVSDTFRLVDFTDAQQLKEGLLAANPQTLPLQNDPMSELVDRCRKSKPVSMHRFDKDFILCYRDFAVYINANGQLSTKIIEWETKDVQNIIFRAPYLLVLGITTMEIREIATGKLVQLVATPGRARLSWEGYYDEGNPKDLALHLITGNNAESREVSVQWYTLDDPSTLYSLFRV